MLDLFFKRQKRLWHFYLPSKEGESPQELPRSQASRVSATRSLNTLYTKKQDLSTPLAKILCSMPVYPKIKNMIQYKERKKQCQSHM